TLPLKDESDFAAGVLFTPRHGNFEVGLNFTHPNWRIQSQRGGKLANFGQPIQLSQACRFGPYRYHKTKFSSGTIQLSQKAEKNSRRFDGAGEIVLWGSPTNKIDMF